MRNEDHSDFTDQRFDLVLVISTLHELRLQSILGQYSLYYAHRVQTDNDGDSRARLNELYGFQVSRIRKDIIGVLRKLIDRNKSVSVLDIGCGFAPYLEDLPDDMNGKVSFTFLDKDENLREALKSKFPSSRFIQCDLLTQISISEEDADNKRKYFLKTFFYFISKKLNVNGILFLSEFYYPRYLKTNEIDAMIGLLRYHVGHGDPAEAFYLPENVNKEAQDLKFSLLEQVDFAPIPLTSNIQWIPPEELLELSKRRYFRSIYCKEEDIDSGSNETKLIKEDSSVEYEGQIAEDITAIRKATKDGLWAAFLKQDKEQDVRKLLDKVVGNEGTDGWRLANSANKIIYWWKEFGRNTRNKVSSFSYLSIWISVTSILSRIFDKEGKCKRFDPLKDGLPCGYFYRMTESSSNESHKEENQPIALGLEKEISYIAYNYLLSKQLTVAENNATGKSINALILDRNKSEVSDDQIKSVAFVCEPEYKIEDSFSARQASILNLCRGRSGKHYTIYCSFSNTESASYLFSANGPQIAGGSGGDKTLSAFLMGKPQSECNDCEKTEYQMLITFLDFLFLGYRIGTNKFSQYEGELAEFITRTRSRFEEVGLHAVYEEYDGYLKSACKEFTEYLCKIHNASSQENFPSVWLTVSLDEPGSEIPVSSVMLFSNGIVGMEFIEQRLIPLLRRPLVEYSAVENDVLNEFKDAQLKISNIRSAIGSIMSRNGSHNIGSHVLAALSHNVGTMPDDRVLYQYIQHRMDYIATATTEMPVWNQPLAFVGNLVKTFLTQRHLLDYITGSEGLKAYQFQNRTVDTTSIDCQPNTIRLHVRRIGDDDNGWSEENNYSVNIIEATNFISYPGVPASQNALMMDLEVAIPGGVVGQHAFFTIVENILRNAAKHEWAKLDKAYKDKGKQRYLDMHIDFKDNPEEGIVEVVAWTDNEYSRTQYKKGDFATKVKSLTKKEIQEFLSREKAENEFDLSSLDADHKKLQVRMARSFIGSNGDLHKENWGLAEMRISAGYLNSANISAIGGLDEKTSSELSLIKPVMVSNGDHYCLGYHFHIPKPRELLVVVPQDLSVDKDTIDCANQKLKRYGVAVITEGEVQKESSGKERSSKLSYAYVLLKEFRKNDEADKQSEDMRKWKLPFRVITTSEEALRPSEDVDIDRRANFVGENKNFFDEKPFKSWLATVVKSDETAKAEAQQLLFDIYRSWARHLKSEKKIKDIPIAIDLKGSMAESSDDASHLATGSGGNSEKSLISDIDLLKMVFGNCFNTAVESFLKMRGGVENEIGTVLNAMKTLTPRKVDFRCSEETGRKLSIEEMIRDQLRNWCSHMTGCELSGRFSQVLTEIDNTPAGDLDDLDIPDGLVEFVDYLATAIIGQARVFLSKYEEHYNTLPKEIVVETDSSVSQEIAQLDGQQIIETVRESDKIKVLRDRGEYSDVGNSCSMQSSVLAYWRHEDSCVTRTVDITGNADATHDIPVNVEYLEPLSGAQSYINSFSLLTQGDDLQKARFVIKLIETGLVKVLVVDERIKKFEEDHSDVKCTFAKIGVAALGEDSEATTSIFNAIEGQNTGPIRAIPIKDYATQVGDYDILIIHQGIIDKKLKNHGDPKVIDDFISKLKEKIRYVIVTTGRGSPANIPDNVRVLPFSVIESTLFKKYPEKLVLVDAIMNVLPSGRKENL